MRETSNFNRLKETLLENSNANTWETAKKEWELKYCYISKDNCTCGHEIINVFLIKNKLNNNQLKIGSSCIDHFKDGDMSSSAKNLLKRQKYLKSQNDNLNTTLEKQIFDDSLIKIAEKSLKACVINQWEFDFYCKVQKYHSYSEKQQVVLKRVKNKLNSFVIKNPSDDDVKKVRVLLKSIKEKDAKHNS